MLFLNILKRLHCYRRTYFNLEVMNEVHEREILCQNICKHKAACIDEIDPIETTHSLKPILQLTPFLSLQFANPELFLMDILFG